MKKIKSKILAVLLAGTMVLGLAGCGSAAETGDTERSADTSIEETGDFDTNNGADSSERKAFRLGVIGEEGSELMELGALAYKAGYIEEELNKIGYDLEVKAFAGAGPEMNEALAADEVDGLVYGDFPAFVSKANGIDTTVIGTVDSKQQYGVLAVGDVKEAKDLEGKRVIVPQGTVAQYFWDHYVKERGLDAGSIEVLNSMDATSLLQTGEADAWVVNIYAQYYMESLGMGTIIDDGGDLEHGSTSYLVEVTTSMLQNDPDVGVALNKALIRAYNDAISDPRVLYDAEVTADYNAEIWEKAYSFDTSLYYLSPEITDEYYTYLEYVNQWLADNGLIPEKVDLENFVDRSYYEKAVEALAEE